MPDLTGNIEEIQNSLKASLGRGQNNLDQNVVAASKRVLLRSIEFKPASAPLSLQCNALKAKYTLLNPSTKAAPWNGTTDQQQGSKDVHKTVMEGANEESLPRPKVVLYPEELLKMEWTSRTPSRIGAGLVNMGNTCFFNSTLQCLSYTAPLVNYCMTGDHRQKCKKNGFCMMCEIHAHIRTTLECGGRSIKPHSMLQKLRCIAKHMKWGRQEDAHEFLRFVVDHLQQSCLGGESKLDRLSKETTVINQIFGGYLRSQVTCLRCQAKSNTFDPFMDLSLDIKGVNTVEDALAKFVKPETLENENAYKCPKCKHKVRAHKRFSIQKPPNILTIQLNRFDFHRHLSGKINRFIKYPERINIRNFMSQRQGEPILYHLYGVLVHSGHSSDCGHYYSYVKSPSKTWYCMNDSMVHQANYQSVFSADAYVLFYARVNRSIPATSTQKSDVKSSVASHKNSFIGPVIPNHKTPAKSPLTNGVHGKPSNDVGTPVPRDQKNSASMPKIVSHASSLPDSHRKISFPILTAQQKKLQQQQDKDEDEDHVVLHIKYGNSTTMLKSPDGKSKVVNGNISTLPWSQNKSGLVPYNDDDSDSEQENNKSSQSAPSPSSKFIHSSASLVKRLAEDHQHNAKSTGDNNLSAKPSPAHKNNSVPLANGAGDNATSHKTHLEKKHSPTPSKNPFVWESSPSSSKSSTSDSRSDSQQFPSPSPSSSNGLHKSQSSDGKHKPTTSSHNSSTLTSPPSKQSGSKPHLSLDLPNPSTSKVKSCGGTWHIYPHEGAPSPRGSNSSSNSMNSTSEWMVESKGGNAKALKDSKDISHPLTLNGYTENKISSERLLAPASSSSSFKHKTISSSNTSIVSSQTPASESKYQSKYFSHNGNATPVDISDKQSLLSPSSSQSSESSSKFGKLFKSRKRKLENGSRDVSLSPPSDDESSNRNSLKKKKKKLKHKKDKEEKRRLLSDSDLEDSDSMKSKGKKHKKEKEIKKRQRSDSDSSSSSGDKTSRKKAKTTKNGKHRKQSSRGSHDGSSSSGEEVYEWVEKTIESPLTKGKVNQVCSQSWNHHIKNDLQAKKKEDEVKSKKLTWDGARYSTVKQELAKNNDYKSQVISWDGGKSQLSKDLEESRKANRILERASALDQELDAGKVKKVKNHKEDTGQKSSQNPFQHFNNFKNKNCAENGETSWSRDHSYFDRSDNNDSHYNGNSNGNHKMDTYQSRNSWHGNKPNHKPFNKQNGGKFSGNGKYFR